MEIRGNYSFRAGWYWIILVGWRLLRLENLGIPINGGADGDMPFMGMKLLRWLWFESRPDPSRYSGSLTTTDIASASTEGSDYPYTMRRHISSSESTQLELLSKTPDHRWISIGIVFRDR
jgi:hypothetical protein